MTKGNDQSMLEWLQFDRRDKITNSRVHGAMNKLSPLLSSARFHVWPSPTLTPIPLAYTFHPSGLSAPSFPLALIPFPMLPFVKPSLAGSLPERCPQPTA